MTLQVNRMLSIIVISINSEDVLNVCLRALELEVPIDGAEVIVVRDEERKRPTGKLGENFSYHLVPSGTTVPNMKKLAAGLATGRVVVFIEDDCQVNQGWHRQLLEMHSSGYDIVGGAIEPHKYTKLKNWGIFFCEYSRFMKPVDGEAFALPGNHIVFKQTALTEILRQLPDGMRDFQMFDLVDRLGFAYRSDPRLCVTNVNDWDNSCLITSPFHHGRSFAALRLTSDLLWQRLAFGLGTPLLPFVFIARVILAVFNRKRYIKEALLSLPYIIVFSSAWAAGEFTGYFFGSGRSPEQWC